MSIHVNKDFMANVKSDELNSLDLRSDIENNNIYDCFLDPQGYVGNRPDNYDGDFHEDDTWAIDCKTADGIEVTSYLYVSEYEYNQDLNLIAKA